MLVRRLLVRDITHTLSGQLLVGQIIIYRVTSSLLLILIPLVVNMTFLQVFRVTRIRQ
ncbi:hypothetical protein J7438_15235 [Thalassotalea sp. G20_0]|nr:hypothetical protein [Thalassotalea sp. G20_0]